MSNDGQVPLLELRAVRKRYPGRKEAVLDGIDLTIAPGERIAITGNSGVGKSTLLRIVGMLDYDFTGEVHARVAERLVHMRNAADFERHRGELLGFVHQELKLLSHLTLLENVMLPLVMKTSRDERRERASKTLEQMFPQWAGPEGHSEALWSIKPRRLSRGERQRVAMARALVGDGKVLLTDEPTASLSDNDARNFIEQVKKIKGEKRAWVVISHRAELFREHKFTFYRLKDGRLMREDS